MTKRILLLLLLTFFDSNISAAETTHYYKCTTHKGTTFSQLPCSPNATEHKLVSHSTSQVPKQDHIKTLNELEREQIIRNINGKIRSKKHEIAILKRERDRAEYQQKQRTKRILSDEETKRIKKDISKQILQIDKAFKQDLKNKNKQLAKLEKRLARYK